MLHAWAKGKRRSPQEFEDEILSAIFGALRLLPGPTRAFVFIELLKLAFPTKFNVPDYDPTLNCCTIRFWPKLGSIEPDMIVSLKIGDYSLICLLEAKWNSDLSENQLQKQWDEAIARYEKSAIVHLLLTREPFGLVREIGSKRHLDNLSNILWCQIAQVASEVSEALHGAEAKAWANDVCIFLSKLNQAPFVGLSELPRKYPDIDCSRQWHFDSTFEWPTRQSAYERWLPYWTAGYWRSRVI